MGEPDARDSAGVLAIGLILYAGVGALGAWEGGVPPVILGAALQAVFLAVPLLYARVVGLRPLGASGFARIRPLTLGLVLLASLGSLWIFKEISELDQRLLTELGLDAERQVRHIEKQVGRATERGGLFAVLVLVVAPSLCEEVFFRGILFRGLARSLGAGWSLALTTLLFASMHGEPVQKVMMVFVGLYFGLMVWLTGSLWAGVIAHAVNNLVVIGVTTLFGGQMKGLETPPWMLALSVVVFGLAVTLLAMERRGRENPPDGVASPP